MLTRYHLLEITIDEYRNTQELPTLRGCVKDGNLMRDCLVHLRGPPVSERRLINGDATRANILSAFGDGLIRNPEVEKGDLIVIFYAGHGGRAMVITDEEDPKLEVETLCPVDDSTEGIKGIPDITVSALLHTLAREKGDNIVFICDCCHSGGIARGADDDEGEEPEYRLRTTRKSTDDSDLIDLDIDRKILSDYERCELGQIGFYDDNSPYIFLAACGKAQSAYENTKEHCGRFTSALDRLLRVLRKDGRDAHTSYASLLQQLDVGMYPRQCPEAHGTFVDRLLFTTRMTPFRFHVVRAEEASFCVSAGEMHGLVVGTKMVTFTGVVLECVRVDKISSVAKVAIRAQDSPSTLWADVQRWSAGELYVYASQDIDASATGKYLLQPTDTVGASDVILRSAGSGETCFSINSTNDRWKTLCAGLDVPLGFRVRNDVLVDELEKIAHFRHHLDVGVAQSELDGEVTLQLYSVQPPKRTWQYWQTASANLFSDSNEAWLDIPDEAQNHYSFEVVNKSPQAWYVYVFAFDLCTFAITPLHMPPIGSNTPCLAPNGTMLLRFGGDSGEPMTFSCKALVSVAFVKLYVCVQNVNMHHIAQRGIMVADAVEHPTEDGARRDIELDRPRQKDESWDTSVSVITYGPGVSAAQVKAVKAGL
ncbi:caspase domain-containing protein [Mycena amicta]|nr:caspase domain-containing protein [Mycena amicta]